MTTTVSSKPHASSVRFLDLQAPYAELKAPIDAALSRVAASGWYILGDEVRAFEEEFARYCGARPITSSTAQRVLSLPIGPHMTEEQVTHVIRAVSDVVGPREWSAHG